MSEAIYRKYRPTTFSDVTGQDHVKTTLKNQIASGSISHAYLLTGPRGVGKTTVARLLAKAVNCLRPTDGEPCNACEACREIIAGSALDVMEVDAASQTGVENVRENIIESVRFAPNKLKYKVYVIDEVHMLSTASFNALLKTLEEPPAHALFILATTEAHKIPATILSRCQRFDFRRLSAEQIAARLKGIVRDEKVKVDDDVLAEIARHADGGLRDAESMLGQVLALDEKHITMDVASLVLPVTNSVMVGEFLSALDARDAKEAMRVVNAALDQGVDLPQFAEDAVARLRDRLMETASAALVPLIESLLEARRQMKGAKIVQLPLELAIVKACGVEDRPKAEVRKVDSGVEEGKLSQVVVSVSSPASGFPPGADQPLAERGGPHEEIPEPLAVAASDIPVLDLEDVRRKWPEVFRQIKDCNATLPMLMQTCDVSGIDGDAIEISFNYALYAETVNQDKNRKLLEGVLSRVLGRTAHVKARHVKKEIDQAVDQLIDAFGGSIVS